MQVAIYGQHVIMDTAAAAWCAGQQMPTFPMDVEGRTLESMPHTLDAVRLFRNMGTELPTPMKANGYAFPGRFQPFRHQLDTADFLAGYDRCFCLNSPGTGKTAAAIWAADYLMKAGVIRRVLVLCPLSCMSAVWADELFNIAPHASQAVVHGPRKTRQKLVASDAKWLITNHDGVKVVRQELCDPANEIDLVIIDECTAYKTENTDRTKALKEVVEGKRIWAMTGTPIPQNPMDAYVMAKLINPDAPRYKYQFQDLTMVKVNKFKWVPRADATEKVYGVLQPAIRFDKSDCLDMPTVTHEFRRVPTTPAQEKLFKEVREEWVADVNGREIQAANAAVRLGKMMQISQGIIIDHDEVPHPVDAEPRYQACYDAIMESVSKSVVFVPYKGAMSQLRDYLMKRGLSVEVVNGDVSESKRRGIFRSFQDAPHPRVLLAHPKTTSHGLTLTAASTTIWFGPVYSAEIYEQANNRTNRPGQEHDMRIIHLLCSTLESQVYKGVKSMNDMQGVLLDMYRRIIDDEA